MKVLLTGATGWIGSNVALELVRKGHEVHCTLRPGSDRRRLAALLGHLQVHEGEMDTVPIKPDLLVHLAWYAVPSNYLTASENEDCYFASKRLIRQVNCRVVSAGTCFEYDTMLGRLTESSPLKPLTAYSRCKNALRHGLEDRPDTAWMRFFYQYGQGEHPARQVPKVIQALQAGTEIKLSAGGQKRDYLDVRDVARAVVAIAESDLTGPVNVGSGLAVPLRMLYSVLGDLSGRANLLRFGELEYYQGEPMLIEADTSKLRSTGWAPKITLEDGLRDAWEWWKHLKR